MNARREIIDALLAGLTGVAIALLILWHMPPVPA